MTVTLTRDWELSLPSVLRECTGDITLWCQDGYQTGHKIALSSLSPHLGCLLLPQCCNDTCLILPDVTVSDIRKILELGYTGSSQCDQQEISDILLLAGSLGLINVHEEDQEPHRRQQDTAPEIGEPVCIV